jgi:hypothetical protein
MPQKINLNSSPYNDDFNINKGYYKVLFRPGYSIQTRELTTLQSILQNQIENFGKSQYKQGQQIVPGEVSFNNKLDYVKLSSVSEVAANINGNIVFQKYDISNLVGLKVQGLSSGVVATILAYAYGSETESDIIYVNYINSGNSSEEQTFRQGETLEVLDVIDSPLLVVGTDGSVLPATIDILDYDTKKITTIDSPAMGYASAVQVEEGVYFINGYFVNNFKQIIVVDKYYNFPSAKVGFNIVERVITPEEDNTLYDNSRGFSNFSAPGAHRLKIDLELIVYEYDAITSSDFIQLVTIKNGVIQRIKQNKDYNIIEETLARRTYDESGDYIVNNFSIDLREYYFSGDNKGTYPLDSKTNLVNGKSIDEATARMVAGLGTGKAYVKGYEIVKTETEYVEIEKARDTLIKEENKIKLNPLSSFSISNVYNSIPVNAEGEDLNSYPDIYLNSVFNDGKVGFKNTSTGYNRRGQQYSVNDAIKTIYVKLGGDNPLFPTDNILGEQLWFVIQKGTSIANVASQPIEILNFNIVNRPDIGAENELFVEYTVLGNKAFLSLLKEYDEDNGLKKRFLFESKFLADNFYHTPNQPAPYAEVLDYNESITPIIGICKPKDFSLQKKGAGFNKDTDIILSKGRIAGGTPAYNSIFKFSYFNPIFFTKIIVDRNLDSNSFLLGKYITGLTSGAYGVVEGVPGGFYSANNTLFVKTLSGEFKPGETIIDEDGNSRRIARENTISHFTVLKRGSGYNVSASQASPILSKVLINGVEYELASINIGLIGSSIYRIDVVNRDLVSEIYNTTPAVSVTVGSGAVVIPVLFKNTVTTYGPQNVKSLQSQFGSNNKYIFTSDVESFDTEFLSSKTLTNFTYSAPKGSKYIECNGFSGDPSSDIIQGDIVQFVYFDNEVVRAVAQYVTQPEGLSKARIYLDISLKKEVVNSSVIRVRAKADNSTTSTLIVPTGAKYINSIVNTPEDSKIKYYLRRDFITTITSSGGNITFAAQLPFGTQRFVSFSENNFLITILDPDSEANPSASVKKGDIIFLTESQVTITSSSDTVSGLTAGSVTVNLPSNFFGIINSFENFKIKLTATIEVNKAKPRLKTSFKNKRIVVSSPGDRVIPFRGVDYDSNSSEVFSYSDAFKLRYIYEGSSTVPPVADKNGNLVSGIDVTDRFTFDNGQRDTFYDVSRIVLKPGFDSPKGQLLIGFDYFEHSQGDFCTVDSYLHEAGVTEEEVPDFNSVVYGKVSLKDVFDFRAKVDTTSILSGYQDISILSRPPSFSREGGIPAGTIATDATIEYSLSFNLKQYLDRIDCLYLDKNGDFVIKKGIPSLNPNKPSDIDDAIPLYYFYLPAFTNSANDVNVIPVNNKRYTMKDIGKLEKRIERLEKYTLLSMLEQQALNMQIKDEIGLDRFKSGFIVDNFENHNIGNLQSVDYKCSIDPQQSILRPRALESSVGLREINSRNEQRILSGYTLSNGVVTLPFTNIPFVSNIFATKKLNINPFVVLQYVGDATLNPPVDQWYSQSQFPVILNNDSKLFSVFYSKNSAREGLASIYNSYSINWIGTNRVFYNSLPLNDVNFTAQATSISASISSSSNISPQNNELAQGVSSTTIGNSTVVSDIEFFCQTKLVKFVLTRMKPKTRLFAFVDGRSVERWISQDFRFTGIAGNSLSTFDSGITTDENGNASGVLLIPSGYAPISGSSVPANIENISYDETSTQLFFVAGNKTVRFTSDDSGSIGKEVDTFTEVSYYVGGSFPQNPASIISTIPAKFKSSEGIQLIDGAEIKPNPLSQTFKVENTPGGIFLTGMDLFFSKKSSTIPVRVYLTNVESGKPGKYIIPGTEKSLLPDTYLRVFTNGTLNIKQGENATGTSSRASGPIKTVLDRNNIELIPSVNGEYTLSNDQIYTLVLSNNNGRAFRQNEDVQFESLTAFNARNATSLRVTIARDSGKVSRLEILNLGSGYESASITIESPQLVGGITAAANAFVSSGNVYEADVTIAGSGYTEAPSVIINGTGQGPSGASIRAFIEIDTPSVRMGVAVDTENTQSTIPTFFGFDYPIYLENDAEYAFAVESDSTEYEIWSSKLGENEITTNASVTSQPLLGSVYKSQNVDTWVEDIFEDIKFTLYRAEFDISRNSILELTNEPLGYEQIENNPFETNSSSDATATSQLFRNNNRIAKIRHFNNGFEDSGNSFVTFKQVRNVGGINSSLLTGKTFKVINNGLEFYNIDLGARATSTEIGGGSRVLATYNRKFEKLYAQIANISLPNTSVSAFVKTTDIIPVDNLSPTYTSYSQNEGFESTFLNAEHIFNNQKVIASRINELKNNGITDKSLIYRIELKSTKSYLSPVIDLRASSAKLVHNQVEKSQGFESRYGRRDQIIKLYSIYKVTYSGIGLGPISEGDIVGSPTNIKTITGYTSRARGIIVRVDKSTNNLWIKMLTDTVFQANETLIFSEIPSLSEFPSNVFTTTGIEEIPFNFNIGSTIVAFDRSDLTKTYNNVINGKVVLWDPRRKELTLSNNKNPINNNYESPANVSPYSRVPFAITQSGGAAQSPDIFRVGDILSFPNIPVLDRAFAEIKSIEYTYGSIFVEEISSKNSSSLAKYVTKEISLENPCTGLDVRMTANIFESDDIQVLYKIKSASTQDNFEDLDWNYFNQSGNSDVSVTPSSENVVSGYLENQNSYKEYKFSVSNLQEYSSFAVKVVMRSSQAVFVPKIQDIRIVASF